MANFLNSLSLGKHLESIVGNKVFSLLLAIFFVFAAQDSLAQDLFVSPEQDVLSRLSSKVDNVTPAEVMGDSINFQTGGVSFRHIDIQLVGRGPDVIISRTYNVASRSAWNWRHDLEFADWSMEIPLSLIHI